MRSILWLLTIAYETKQTSVLRLILNLEQVGNFGVSHVPEHAKAPTASTSISEGSPHDTEFLCGHTS